MAKNIGKQKSVELKAVQIEKAEQESKQRMRFGELGTSGLERWGGIVDEEWLKEFKGERKWRTIREMKDNDPVIGAILFAVDMLIRQVRWRVEPFSDSKKDTEAKEFLQTCMDDMSHSWTNTISEVLSFLPYGFNFSEIVYKKRMGPKKKDPSKRSKFKDGKIGWRKIAPRAQSTLDSWVFDDDGGIQGFVQADPLSNKLITIPIEKGLLFRTTIYKNNPEGKSALRNCFRSWLFKKHIEEIEGIGIERDLAGLPVIYCPNKVMLAGAGTVEAAVFAELKKIVRNVRRDEQEGIIMPGDRDENGNRLYEMSLLSTGGKRNFDTDAIIKRYEGRIAMTMLADFILMGHSKVGSFALSSNKTTMFATAIGAWLGEIKSVFNTHAVPRLFELNGFVLEGLPKLVHEDIETPDLKELGEFIGKLTGAGAKIFPDLELENVVRRFATLPEKTPEKEAELEAAEEKRLENENAAKQQAAEAKVTEDDEIEEEESVAQKDEEKQEKVAI